MVGGGPVIAYDRLRVGVEGGAGANAGILSGERPDSSAAVQLSAGYEPGTTHLRLDATNLVFPTNTNEEFSSATPPEADWRFGAGVAFDHGRVGVAATGGGGVFQGLSNAARSGARVCDSGWQPVFTATVGVRLLGKRLGLFVHPRIEGQQCLINH